MKGLLGTLGALVVAAGVCWQPASALSATSNTHRILLGGKVLTIKQGFANAGPKAAVVFAGKRLGGYDHEAVRLYMIWFTDDGDFVVLHIWPGNPHCNGYFQVLTVLKGRLVRTKPFGGCLPGWVEPGEDRITFRFRNFAKSLTKPKIITWVFRHGVLARVK